jgi:hypothetical protein
VLPVIFHQRGNKKPYDNYANVKADIEEILRRIQLNPTDKALCLSKKLKNCQQMLLLFFKNSKMMVL